MDMPSDSPTGDISLAKEHDLPAKFLSHSPPLVGLKEIEALVAGVLKLDGVDPEANLLELGASSIDLIRILNVLDQNLHFRPSLARFFGSPTVATLAQVYIEQQSPLPSQTEAASTVEPLTASILFDPEEREAFKRRHLHLRPADSGRSVIPLTPVQPDENRQRLYMTRRSQRDFSKFSVPLAQFSAFLGCLQQITVDQAPKYRYPSAGGLYPVQVYLYVKANRVERLPSGIYYYHPVQHHLVALATGIELKRTIYDPLINRPIFDKAAFSLFLIAQLNAIAPLYGEVSRDFCLLEAGYMGQLLMEAAPACRVGLCPVGNMDFEQIRALFALDEGHILVHSFLGGRVDIDVPRHELIVQETPVTFAVDEREEGEL